MTFLRVHYRADLHTIGREPAQVRSFDQVPAEIVTGNTHAKLGWREMVPFRKERMKYGNAVRIHFRDSGVPVLDARRGQKIEIQRRSVIPLSLLYQVVDRYHLVLDLLDGEGALIEGKFLSIRQKGQNKMTEDLVVVGVGDPDTEMIEFMGYHLPLVGSPCRSEATVKGPERD